MKKVPARERQQEELAISERHKFLLACYFDDEASWIQRLRVEQLLRSDPAAALYLEQISALRTDLSAVTAAAPKSDLWGRVAKRIDQEQRNAVYTRKPAPVLPAAPGAWWAATSETVGRKFSVASLGYGFSAGAVSAAIMFLTLVPRSDSSPGINGTRLIAEPQRQQFAQAGAETRGGETGPFAAAAAGAAAQSVVYSPFDIQGTDFDLTPSGRRFGTSGDYRSVSNLAASTSGRLAPGRSVHPVEIDWVRSDGRLRVMREEHESNPVIFVAPRLRATGAAILQNGGGLRESGASRRSMRPSPLPLENRHDAVVPAQPR